jgi:hypothetical protein
MVRTCRSDVLWHVRTIAFGLFLLASPALLTNPAIAQDTTATDPTPDIEADSIESDAVRRYYEACQAVDDATARDIVVPINVAVVPSVTVGGLFVRCPPKQVTNLVAVGVLGHAAERLIGVDVSGLASFYSGPVIGVQASGLASAASGPVAGVQVGGLASAALESGGGVQVGGLASFADGSFGGIQVGGLAAALTGTGGGLQVGGVASFVEDGFWGIQTAGLAAAASGRLRGIQAGGLVGFADKWIGVQVSSLASVSGASGYGLQAAGIASVTGDDAFGGLQVSGVASVAGEQIRGLQASGVASIVGEQAYGLQVSGVANVAGERITGAQVGLINVASEVRGVQVGLVNVAESYRGVPIGLVSYVDGVGIDGEVWADAAGGFTVAVRSGSRRITNYLGAVTRPFAPSAYRWGATLGLGVAFGRADPLGAEVRLRTETLQRADFSRTTGAIHSLEAIGHAALLPDVKVFGGPAARLFVGNDAARDGDGLVPYSLYRDTWGGDAPARGWIGGVVGLRVVL